MLSYTLIMKVRGLIFLMCLEKLDYRDMYFNSNGKMRVGGGNLPPPSILDKNNPIGIGLKKRPRLNCIIFHIEKFRYL